MKSTNRQTPSSREHSNSKPAGGARHSVRAVPHQPDVGAHGVTRPTVIGSWRLKLGAALMLGGWCWVHSALAQSSTFTYQGRLETNGIPVSGTFTFQPTLWDAASGGSLVAGNSPTTSNVTVSNGLFLLPLNFGPSALNDGAARWLQIEVAPAGDPFVTLNPRQPLTSAPYAYRAALAGAAETVPAANVTGTLGLGQLPSGVITNLQTDVNLTGNFSGDGSGLDHLKAWSLSGNPSISPGANFLGTTDNQPLEFRVDNRRGLRIEPSSFGTVNVIAGWADNLVGGGVTGAAIAGGGAGLTNQIEADFAVIAGGAGHSIASEARYGVISGGHVNEIQFNASVATIGGGNSNVIQSNALRATISGGDRNSIQANARSATIGGGNQNTIRANGWYGTIPGGDNNSATNYAFAAGRRAKANQTGSFVWADATDADFTATATNQFLVRASGGVGVNTDNPTAALHIGGTPGVDGIRFPDQTLQTTAAVAPQVNFGNGAAVVLTATTAFISPTVSVTLTRPGRIQVTSHCGLGSTAAGGATSLNLYIAYRPSAGAITTVGNGIFGLTAAQNQRHLFGLSAVTGVLPAGTYEVGLAGRSTAAVNWNNNEFCYTTAVVY